MDIQIWANELTSRVRKKWEELKDRDAAFFAGYSVFYSPVRYRPEWMILGYNPGGGTADFDPEKSGRVPDVHDYFASEPPYRLAARMRDLFESAGMLEDLRESVKTNLIFFRTKDVEAWKRIPRDVRLEAERFCFSTIAEIVRVLKPKRIFTEGLTTYATAKRILSASGAEETKESNGRPLVMVGAGEEFPLIGVMHPSGARISKEEWILIRDEIRKRAAIYT